MRPGGSTARWAWSWRVHLARAGLPVDAIAFADEEGHYGSFIGSRSFTGLLEEAEIDRLANRYHGKPLRTALEEAGLAGKPRLAARGGAVSRLLRDAYRAGHDARERATSRSGW